MGEQVFMTWDGGTGGYDMGWGTGGYDMGWGNRWL